MDGYSIGQCEHAQVALSFWEKAPMPYSAIRLNLGPDRFTDGLFTPLATQIGLLAQDLLLKIPSRGHRKGPASETEL